ncbi:Protein mak11 [Malassezia caprae]|uniref:Protein mak11 n=1 Tax=Malassezia caprae TaxID=1381934 RepID=A0AAF0E5C0_9BASI|nr:Protein mak11 [Malassezia caprae]
MAKPGGMKGSGAHLKASATVFRKSAKRSKTQDGHEDKESSENPAKRAKVPPPPAGAKSATQRSAPQSAPRPAKKSSDAINQSKESHKKAPAKTKDASVPPKKREVSQVEADALPKPSTEEPKRNATSKQNKESTKKAVLPQAPPNGFRIVAGSYERFLYGLEGSLHRTADDTYEATLVPRFVFPAHVSSVRSVACAGRDSKWLVTGGVDETIKVWDLRRRKEVGALTGHEGTITSLSFPSRTFMLSTSEDGTINLYRTRDWALLRTLRGHTGRINSASAHPSGRVALSVGADRTIRLWDLMRGVGSSSVKIGIEADRILWDTRGQRFAVLAGRQVMIFGTDMTKLAEVEQPKRLHDVYFVRAPIHGTIHELMLVASEDGQVHVYDVDDLQETDESATPRALVRLVGHKNRVRSAQATLVRADDGTEHIVVSTISSDGFIRVFDLDASSDADLESVGEYDTKKSRLTSLSAVGYDELASTDDADEVSIDEDDDALDEDEEVDDMNASFDADVGGLGAHSDEDTDEELARLEEEVRQARAAGIIIEGMDDEDDEDEDEQEIEGEEEHEAEDE